MANEQEIKTMNEEMIDLKKYVGSDDIQYKDIIRKKLISNPKIIHYLNDPDLDEDCPEDYFWKHIYPYYLLIETQTKKNNYICFETSFDDVSRFNDVLKMGQIVFYIVCDSKDIKEESTGIPRHDLLASLIIDEFNWSNEFGTQIKLVSDRPVSIDSQYIGRTLIFEQLTPNSIVKQRLPLSTDKGQNRKIYNYIGD